MVHPGWIGDGRRGPVAECVNARTVHRSLSWFKSRPGLQPSLLRSFGLAGHLQAKAGQRSQWRQNRSKMPVDWAFKTLSRLRNLV
jgi:hypothetical protein